MDSLSTSEPLERKLVPYELTQLLNGPSHVRISELTRRDIFDAIASERFNWCGRLEEVDFLRRLYDLDTMESYDSRFENAAGDIWQHRVNNWDWEDDWLFTDERFGLNNGDDEILLRFLCETLHPVVRSDAIEVEKFHQLFNQILVHDGYQLIVKTKLSGKPVFVGRYVGTAESPGVANARDAFETVDVGYVAQQITRMEAAVYNDPDLAIGTAKELVETCCKTILGDKNITPDSGWNLAQLVKNTSRELKLTPKDIPDGAKAADTIKRLLNNMATITQGIAELRNSYGTGHGRAADSTGLQPRHAKLAIGAASTLAVFLMETHEHRESTVDVGG